MNPETLIATRDVSKVFQSRAGFGKRISVRAVDRVSLSVERGETLGVVGESGSGKSTLARLLLRLEAPTGGSIEYKGADLWRMSRDDLRRYRREVQVVFQNPYSSLNHAMTVGEIVGEPLVIQGILKGDEARRRVAESLEAVGLKAADARQRPARFSGGQRQRIAIARAISVRPELLILDEPTSALDVSIRAQILNLLKKLQQEYHLTYLFISHDLAVVRYIADEVIVMYAGQVVETGEAESLIHEPKHPYSQNLLASVPHLDPRMNWIQGVKVEPAQAPDTTGCRYRSRCPYAFERCPEEPPHYPTDDGGTAACFLWDPAEQARREALLAAYTP